MNFPLFASVIWQIIMLIDDQALNLSTMFLSHWICHIPHLTDILRCQVLLILRYLEEQRLVFLYYCFFTIKLKTKSIILQKWSNFIFSVFSFIYQVFPNRLLSRNCNVNTPFGKVGTNIGSFFVKILYFTTNSECSFFFALKLKSKVHTCWDRGFSA